ncbi:MAG: hypothetical protein NC541_07600 [bacterium]|nr:hypothetical protein [bacterium]
MNAQDIFDGITDIRDDLVEWAENDAGERECEEQERGEQKHGEQERGEQERRKQERGEQERGEQERRKQERREQERGEQEHGEQERGEQERGEQERREQGRGKQGHGGQKRGRRRHWLGAVAAVLVIALLAGVFLRPDGSLRAYAIAEAQYPEMAPYPSGSAGFSEKAYDAWRADLRARQRDLGDISALQSFFAQSARIILTGEEQSGENRIYSPLNVYMALSMLAQLTDGESREQILTVLGSESMDALRQQAGDVWNCSYRDDGAQTSILAASLWLSEAVEFNRDTMDILARDFYASSYQGRMGSDQLNGALQSWLSEQTGGLLEEQAGNVELDQETVLALATTVYFRAKWRSKFFEGRTVPQTFHTPAGDVETDFMHQGDGQSYYWGDKFAAVIQSFEEGGVMCFLLPDEGVTPEELLSDGEAMDFLFTADRDKWEKQKYLIVNKAVPKFDVSSQLDLSEGLQKLGITDLFDPRQSDFSPVTADPELPMFLSQVNHAARVTIDEEGCTAAAFTVMADYGGMPPADEVNFILDRPFLFCVTGGNGLPLFVGIVNYPAGEEAP